MTTAPQKKIEKINAIAEKLQTLTKTNSPYSDIFSNIADMMISLIDDLHQLHEAKETNSKPPAESALSLRCRNIALVGIIEATQKIE